MEDILILKWNYTPADFFEESQIIQKKDYKIIINNGTIEAYVKPEIYDDTENVILILEEQLVFLFSSSQVLSNKEYSISKPIHGEKYDHDGHKTIIAFPETSKISVKSYPLDIIISDKDGVVSYDSKKERIRAEQEHIVLFEKYKNDTTLKSMLKSYSDSINDPDNEFFYLYEIRDALRQLFLGDKKNWEKLHKDKNEREIFKEKYDEFGRIINKKEIDLSRHRGQFAGKLSKTSEEDKKTVREFAKSMIKDYVKYLESQQPK